MIVTADYYSYVTGELDKAAKALQEEIEIYPRGTEAYEDLVGTLASLGQYEKAVEIARQASRFEPDSGFWHESLASTDIELQQFDEAMREVHEAQQRSWMISLCMGPSMIWPFSGPTPQRWPKSWSGLGVSPITRTLDLLSHRRLRHIAAYGNRAGARMTAAKALKLAPESQGAEVEAALAFAVADNTARAEILAQDLAKRFPLDTQMQLLWLPAIRAQIALDRKNPASALKTLQVTSPIELGNLSFGTTSTGLYWLYVRGDAYLAAGQGAAAAGEFQKILDHNGLVQNCWTGALAHSGVARANALQSRTPQGADAAAARGRALAAYKDFLTLWKDADPDISILRQAKAEYAKLQSLTL